MPVERAARGAASGRAQHNDEGLVLRDVSKRWGPRPVLDRLALEVAPGRVVRVKGPNGAGKTTMLRIVTGLVRPDGGSVSLDGLDAAGDRAAYVARIGFVSAGDHALYARLSAARHLALAADLAGIPATKRATAIATMTAAFDLDGIASRRVDRLSAGQRQRVRLALAFLHEPRLVLLDEPANSLDDEGIALLSGVLQTHTARGGAVLWCAPATSDAPIPFDERLLLTEGRLVPE
jgi:ABC-2 type transport system ATP-binding protein